MEEGIYCRGIQLFLILALFIDKTSDSCEIKYIVCIIFQLCVNILCTKWDVLYLKVTSVKIRYFIEDKILYYSSNFYVLLYSSFSIFIQKQKICQGKGSSCINPRAFFTKLSLQEMIAKFSLDICLLSMTNSNFNWLLMN